MIAVEWKSFLQRYSDEVLATELEQPLPADVRAARWLGFDAASEAAITATEARLGQRLPASLREFYGVTNGWRHASLWKALESSVRPVEELGWLADREPHLHHLVCQTEETPGPFKNDPDGTRLAAYREEQGTRVKRSLLIGVVDCSYWLLDPGPAPHCGEWPAGIWAYYLPAMEWRAPSFSLLMVSELDFFLESREM